MEQEFLQKYDLQQYERPSLAVDMAVFSVIGHGTGNYRKLSEQKLSVLLIERAEHPFQNQWALPGGFVLPGETVETAARRELEEETGIVVSELTEVGRIVDTSKHSAYVEYMCITDWDKDNIRLQEGETIAYKWVTRDELLAMKEDELVTERIQNFIEDLRL